MAYNNPSDSFKEEREKVSWNMSSKVSEHLSDLLHKASQYQLEHNLRSWLDVLCVIREKVNYGMSSEEQTELDNLELEIINMKSPHLINDMGEKIQDTKQRYTIYLKVRQYQRKVLDILNKMGFFPSKPDATRLNL